MTRYRLSREAAEDVFNIYLDGLELFGDRQAQSYHDEMERVFDMIATYPEAGRSRDSVAAHIRIMPFRSHIIVYRPDPEDHIRILRVRHSAEDWIDDPIGAPQ